MPSMFRSFVAVMFGLMLIFVLRALLNLVAVHSFGTHPALAGRVFAFNVAAILFSSLVGGLFTATLAGERRVRHGYVLAIVVFILAAMAVSRNPVMGAPVQQILLLVGPPIAVVAGAFFSERFAQR